MTLAEQPDTTKDPIAIRIRNPRPFAHEIVAFVYVVVAVFFLERLPVTYPRTALFLAFLTPMGAAGLIGFAILIARSVQRWRSAGVVGWFEVRTDVLVLARSVLLLALTLPTHFLVKSFIYLFNSRTWDFELLQLDQIVHLGFSPSRFLVTLLDHDVVFRSIDLIYSGFYFFVIITYVGIFLSVLPRERRIGFTASYVVLWIIGTILYVALPSWGPVFIYPSDFEPALRNMPATVSVQSVLYEEINGLVTNPLAGRVIRFGSVAAFPSLHVAVVMLFTLMSRELSEIWFRMNLLLLAVMVVGSVVTGYHYLIDAWAGIAIGWGVFVIGKKLYPLDADRVIE